jgi:large subunit ribosomal protein L22
MRTSATAKYIRVSSRKAGLVLEQIRGKSVGEALAILEYTPRAAARLISKVLRSAVANAEHNHQVRNLDTLRIVEAVAEGGPSLKRVQPRAMGRAFFIRHRTSHLRVAVSDELNASHRRLTRREALAAAGAVAPPPAERPRERRAPAPSGATGTTKADKPKRSGARRKTARGKGKEKD